MIAMCLLDATERAKPVMEYVYWLQREVRRLRGIQTGFKAASFGAGLALGAFLGFAAGFWFVR